MNGVSCCKTRWNWSLFLPSNDMAYNVTRKYMYYDMDLKFNNNWCVLRKWNLVFQCKIEIRNVSCFVVKKRLNIKFLFPCDCLKVPLKSIKIVQRKCILLFTVQNVVRSRTMHVLNKRCVNLEGKKISKYQTHSI